MSELVMQTGSGLSLIEWFQVKSGEKQECNVSGFLFLLVIDWIMRKATADNNTGIRWKFTSKLEDLDFADDIALISSSRQQIQTKTDRVNNITERTGLKFNTSKTQVMRIHPTSNAPISLDGKDLEEVDSFISQISQNIFKRFQNSSDEDIRRKKRQDVDQRKHEGEQSKEKEPNFIIGFASWTEATRASQGWTISVEDACSRPYSSGGEKELNEDIAPGVGIFKIISNDKANVEMISFVVHYTVEERASASGKVTFHNEKQGHKYLAVPVVSGAKIKGVTCFCLNENPLNGNPFSVEICVALRKKQLQLYSVTEDRLAHIRDVHISEPAIALSLDSTFICAALASQYCMIDFDSGNTQDLFPYDGENNKPLIKRISKEEFLLSGPSALGMFVTSAGVSQRPPLQWSENLVSISYVHPYIIAMNDEFITIHSILDQQQKQAIPFQGGTFMENFDGRLFVASGREIYCLVPVAWEKQVQALLQDKRVTEALELAKNANKTGSKDKYLKIYKRLQQQAAFIEFSQQHFEEAEDLFKAGQLDVREVICLYPKLMPSNSTFTRSVPPLHEIADIHQLTRGNDNLIKEYKTFLQQYLEDIKGSKEGVGFKQEIDTALLKLYAEMNSPELIPLIAVDTGCDLKDCVEWLEKFHRYHALALLYKYHSDHDKALHIWQRLVNKEIEDEVFPGLNFVIEYLSNLNDHELVWKYIDWVLTKDPENGVKIFTERPQNELPSERLRPETVIDYLHRFPKAVISYLEYLVFQKKLEKEKYHTHLAVLYLDTVLKLMKDSSSRKEEVDVARSKLRHMLQMSALYRVQLILGKAKEMDMHAECAILYGKLEEHDKALRILVHKLKDYGAAENYCMVNSQGKDPLYRKRLFHILLSVYLDPSHEHKDQLVRPAVELLNSNIADFDTIKVLQSLPENWSVSLLSQFLTQTVRKSMNLSRNTRIERMMSRGENLQVKQNCIEREREYVTMNDDRLCAVCSRAFSDPTFVRYPNGVVTHVHCARSKHICPVTGKLFSTKKS
ncbi:hypothetical protein FSP39_021971 [Pinctada imbricata]|uniref:Transforming growth factor-beta receptor-associated protein 1 n=1 Tax=Pinctada imbricata TaxID=66713 RepID=A0AA88YFE3_PINIB|nr:hypothetical protein FSP39_021971 [Pinctada imbricata]